MKEEKLKKGYIKVSEAADITGLSIKNIRHLYERQLIKVQKNNENNRVIGVRLNDVKKYALAHPPQTDNLVWGEIDYRIGECFYPLFDYDCRYFVSNFGRVINASNCKILTPQPSTTKEGKTDGYTVITLMKNGKPKNEYLHKLIELTQCPNALNKENTHHIYPSNPSVDTSDSIISVTPEQHTKLHKIINNENDFYKYHNLINKIKGENESYKIPHLDFEDDSSNHYYMIVNYEGYIAYQNGRNIPTNTIIEEGVELK